jgi:hypothetical protein
MTKLIVPFHNFQNAPKTKCYGVVFVAAAAAVVVVVVEEVVVVVHILLGFQLWVLYCGLARARVRAHARTHTHRVLLSGIKLESAAIIPLLFLSVI